MEKSYLNFNLEIYQTFIYYEYLSLGEYKTTFSG